MKTKDNLVAYLFLAPFLIIFAVFLGYPTIYSLYLSLHRATIYSDWYNVFADMKFVGLDNYVKLLTTDVKFWWSVIVTGIYAFLTIPTSIGISLVLAVLLNNKFRGKSFFRSAFFLPNVLDMLVVGIIWVFIYTPKVGVVDIFLSKIGIHTFSQIGVLDNPWTALPGIALAMILKGAGFGMILFLTAIQNIPSSVYEAADIDGANWWHKLWYITLPLVKPIILFMVVTGTLASLNAFTEIYAMTNATGGPAVQVLGTTAGATRLSGFYLFKNFESGQYGYAAAISYLMLVLALVVSLINVKFLGKGE
ncbi:MAG: hypothetical protein CVV64_02090 [Candidatus Wallbacteria bacterium HGW-Wallbacteria-1]|jgi:ABC-type sugar transport system permease subunit|uniref:ABC transmembrane type-1 domain-containing protein n=1 Tax=Candidatus Wallbacteria bacterium HGW-Wallbacteria-1 TaxID=2013854 RepID=A0A2N1PV55_9BACT|nr:MAG: hypothetical protein CVV64_02090 [Candidatus Wallbacteria bacterium HGW-Wallbacteria-1]